MVPGAHGPSEGILNEREEEQEEEEEEEDRIRISIPLLPHKWGHFFSTAARGQNSSKNILLLLLCFL